MIFREDVPVKGKSVKSRVVQGTAVLMNLAGRDVYRLNKTGSRVWELADGERCVLEIAGMIAREFDVNADDAVRDVLSLFAELEKEGLVHFRAAK